MNDPTDWIPHRPPILCVDRVVEIGAEHAVTEYVVRDAWEPILVEGLAQTAAVLNASDDRKAGRTSAHEGVLVGVRKFDVVRAPRAGERVTLRVELIRRITPLTLMRGEVRDEAGEIVARGELKFYVEATP